MRLGAAPTEVILNCVRQQFGANAQVMLFGSRLDDAARGGDVDLLVETATRPTLHQCALTTLALEQAPKVRTNIVAQQRGASGRGFARRARSRAQLLEPLA